MFTWGINDCGQLGHGDNDGRDVPERVDEFIGTSITEVYGGYDFSAFRTSKLICKFLIKKKSVVNFIHVVEMNMDSLDIMILYNVIFQSKSKI